MSFPRARKLFPTKLALQKPFHWYHRHFYTRKLKVAVLAAAANYSFTELGLIPLGMCKDYLFNGSLRGLNMILKEPFGDT